METCLLVLLLLIFAGFAHPAAFGPCQCAPLERCTDEDTTINGHGIVQPRIRCQNPNDVCCEFVIPEDNPHLNKFPKYDPLVFPPAAEKCGLMKNVALRVTSDGTTADFAEFPWNLLVMEHRPNRRHTYICGASLIHPRVSLTAAHCVMKYHLAPGKIFVRAGEWDTSNHEEPLPMQDNYVGEIVVHPMYHRASLKNDIALLFHPETFLLTENVGLICLPPPGVSVYGSQCIASGWGKESISSQKRPTVLRKVQVPMVETQDCLAMLRRTSLGRRYQLHESFLCAGGERGKDACEGDGGAPLVCPVEGYEDRFVQTGIVSWGIGCGTKGIPGVYVNVVIYLKWIDRHLSDRKLDTSVYRLSIDD